MNRTVAWAIVAAAPGFFALTHSVSAQMTAFTYQGSLKDGVNPASGNYDFEFALYDALSGGTQLGSTLTQSGVNVANGIFSVSLDFGSQFPGANRFLEIHVRQTGGGAFTPLAPRQAISSAPYAVKSLNADAALNATNAVTATTANNALSLGGVAASQYVLTGDPRMSDARDPLPGSANYIQNGTAQQTSSNFNISGNGTTGGTLSGNVINATTQFNINGNRILSVAGINNLFAGTNAGQANTSGAGNSFVGTGAGQANTVGMNNAFFGFNAGLHNVGDNFGNGSDNSFFGRAAGQSNTTGVQNSFFGSAVGLANTIGNYNSFFGAAAGLLNANGNSNSFFGYNAGSGNTGSFNNFFGDNAGTNNASTNNNFFGFHAGAYHTTGNSNNFFGANAGLGDPNNGSTGIANNFFGDAAGVNFISGNNNSLFGDAAGSNISTANNNSFFGKNTGSFNTTGSNNTFVGALAGNLGFSQLSNSTAIGHNAKVDCSSCIVLGDAGDAILKVIIGSTTACIYKLSVSSTSLSGVGGFSQTGDGVFGMSGSGDGVGGVSTNGYGVFGSSTNSYGVYGSSTNSYAGYFNGKIHVASVPFGTGTPVLVTPGGDIVAQGSSLRSKTNVHPFFAGLDIVRRLQPINFNWKQDGQPDIGLGAEDVAKVAPLFIYTDGKGEISGVKYAQLSALFINAFKEQQAQIEKQRSEIAQLKSLVCRHNRRTKVCRTP